MPKIQNRIAVKQNLESRIQELQNNRQVLDGSPLTDLEIDRGNVRYLEALATELEKRSPFPKPLIYANQLLDGAWLLEYSTAREIRSLRSLPFGFQVGKIYQIIDIKTASFENKAWKEKNAISLTAWLPYARTQFSKQHPKDCAPFS